MKLSRSNNGAKVHESGCPSKSQKTPWLWAEPFDLRQLAEHLIALGLTEVVKPCQICLPDVDWHYAAADPATRDGIAFIAPTETRDTK